MPSRPRSSTVPGALEASEDLAARTARFLAWFDDALRYRDLDAATLAKKCGIAKSTISNWRNRLNVPSAETCLALADVLVVPRLYVLWIAGHLRSDDLMLSINPTTGASQITTVSDPRGGRGVLPVPAQQLEPDAVARAKMAILQIPDEQLTGRAKWQVVGMLETMTNASALARELQSRGEPLSTPPPVEGSGTSTPGTSSRPDRRQAGPVDTASTTHGAGSVGYATGAMQAPGAHLGDHRLHSPVR